MNRRIRIRIPEMVSALLPSFGAAAGLTILYVGLLATTGPTTWISAILPALAIMLLYLSHLEFAFLVVVASLFLEVDISWFSASVWVALPLVATVLWRFRSSPMPPFSRPLKTALLWYGLCILPSFFVTAVPMASAYRMLNVLAFLVVLFGASASFRRPSDFRWMAVCYLSWTVLNSFDVILESLVLHRRSFGFTGIMFVDLSALGLCLTIALATVSRGLNRFVLVVVSTVISVGLILTQTRNTWISAAVTLFFLTFYVLRFPERAGLTRISAVRLAVAGTIILFISVGVAFAVNPDVGQRTFEVSKFSGDAPAVSESGGVSSSLVSRALIWSTAFNAFIAHPITGIGVYSFPFVSREYATIPPLLYRRFVEQLTPHQTHIAVLAETGIIGFIGFAGFLITALRIAFRAVPRSRDPHHRQIALIALVANVYVATSMFFTDAWLWGSLIVLYGLILGLTVANAREIDRFAGGAESRVEA